MNKYLIILIGVIVGVLYYYNMKLSIKKPYQNCSLLVI